MNENLFEILPEGITKSRIRCYYVSTEIPQGYKRLCTPTLLGADLDTAAINLVVEDRRQKSSLKEYRFKAATFQDGGREG